MAEVVGEAERTGKPATKRCSFSSSQQPGSRVLFHADLSDCLPLARLSLGGSP